MKCYDINCPKRNEQDLIRSIPVIPQFFVLEAPIPARHFDLALHQFFFYRFVATQVFSYISKPYRKKRIRTKEKEKNEEVATGEYSQGSQQK